MKIYQTKLGTQIFLILAISIISTLANAPLALAEKNHESGIFIDPRIPEDKLGNAVPMNKRSSIIQILRNRPFLCGMESTAEERSAQHAAVTRTLTQNLLALQLDNLPSKMQNIVMTDNTIELGEVETAIEILDTLEKVEADEAIENIYDYSEIIADRFIKTYIDKSTTTKVADLVSAGTELNLTKDELKNLFQGTMAFEDLLALQEQLAAQGYFENDDIVNIKRSVGQTIQGFIIKSKIAKKSTRMKNKLMKHAGKTDIAGQIYRRELASETQR